MPQITQYSQTFSAFRDTFTNIKRLTSLFGVLTPRIKLMVHTENTRRLDQLSQPLLGLGDSLEIT